MLEALLHYEVSSSFALEKGKRLDNISNILNDSGLRTGLGFGSTKVVVSVDCFDISGDMLVCCGQSGVSNVITDELRCDVWQISKQNYLAALEHPMMEWEASHKFTGAKFTGSMIVTANANVLRLWDTKHFTLMSVTEMYDLITCIEVGNDGNIYVAIKGDSNICIQPFFSRDNPS